MSLTLFNACQENTSIDEALDVSVVDSTPSGVLEFSSTNDVQEMISQMRNKQSDQYDIMKEQYGIITLEEFNNSKLKSASTENEDVEAEPEDNVVFDPYLIKLLNEKKAIIVDGYYYRFTKNGMLRTAKEEATKLDRCIQEQSIHITSENDGNENTFIEVAEGIELFYPKKIFESVDELNFANDALKSSNLDGAIMNECDEHNKTIVGDIIAGVVGYSVNCEGYFSSARRVKTVFWAQNWFFYSSVGIKVKMQAKEAGIWWAKKAQNLELGWDKVIYKVNYDLSPSYVNLAISEDILNYHFYDLAHFDKILEIIKTMKLSDGSFPSALTLHKKLCDRNFKEWTTRSIEYYDDQFADLVWYQKDGDYDKTLNKILGYGSKALLDWLKSELNTSWDPDQTGTNSDWNSLPENKVITLISESMEITRVVLPREAAKQAANDNKIEKILDYSRGALAFGISNKGGKSFFNAKFYEAPSSFSLQDGSCIYGIAKYRDHWRGSRVYKRP